MRRVHLMAALLVAGGSGPAAAQYLDSITAEALAAELITAGYRAEVGKTEGDQPMVKAGMQGGDVYIILFGCDEQGACTSLTLRQGFNLDPGMSYEHINQWNYDNRMSRAFLDEERDPFIEGDILMEGGISQDNLMASIAAFEEQLARFKTFIGWN
jgi:hypothetical protein